jgi:predicted O-linked N-acetylglucosamine transferase (SPINDLY family)
MKNCGLNEYVTCSQKEYIDKAVWFANNINKLTGLKQRVRDAFINGPICDYTGFTDEFENKLVDLYKKHKW